MVACSAYQAGALAGRGRRANVAVAVANLGRASMASGALEGEERLGGGPLAATAPATPEPRRGAVEARARAPPAPDSRRACATLEEALARASDAGDPPVEAEVLRRLARAYLELGDPEKAGGDARRAAGIARSVGDAGGGAEAEEIAREADEGMRGE